MLAGKLLLFIVSPHTDDLNRLHIIEDLVDNSMLDINPPGASLREIANQLLIRRQAAIGILSENVEMPFGLWL